MIRVFDIPADNRGVNNMELLSFLGKHTSHPLLEKYATVKRSNEINVFVVNQEIDNYTLQGNKSTQKGNSLVSIPGSTDINNYSFEELLGNADFDGNMTWNGILKSTIQTHDCCQTIVCPSCKGSGKCYRCSGEGFVVCKECEGSGKCGVCDGTGSEICPDCDGHGEYKCEHCDGDGFFDCEDCNGSGVYNHNGHHSECRRCEGTGKLTCRKCNGEGKIKCNNCDGDGTITCRRCEGDGICSDCNGEGKVQCEKCKGSGVCDKCKGTGNITCPRCGGLGCFQSFQSYTINQTRKRKEKIFPQGYQDVVEKTNSKTNIWTGKICHEKQKYVSSLDKTSLNQELSPFTGAEDVIKYIISIGKKELPQVLFYQNVISVQKSAITEVTYSVGKKDFCFFLINNNKQIVVDTDKLPNKLNIIRCVLNAFKKK